MPYTDQIEQRQAAIDVAAGDLDHQAQVAFDHALAAGGITTLRKPSEMHLFRRREQWREADFIEIELCGVERSAIVGQLRPTQDLIAAPGERLCHGGIGGFLIEGIGIEKQDIIPEIVLGFLFVLDNLS